MSSGISGQPKRRSKGSVVSTTYEFPMRQPTNKSLRQIIYDGKEGKVLGRTPRNWGKKRNFLSDVNGKQLDHNVKRLCDVSWCLCIKSTTNWSRVNVCIISFSARNLSQPPQSVASRVNGCVCWTPIINTSSANYYPSLNHEEISPHIALDHRSLFSPGYNCAIN